MYTNTSSSAKLRARTDPSTASRLKSRSGSDKMSSKVNIIAEGTRWCKCCCTGMFQRCGSLPLLLGEVGRAVNHLVGEALLVAVAAVALAAAVVTKGGAVVPAVVVTAGAVGRAPAVAVGLAAEAAAAKVVVV
jgi:hypothetical protein